MQKAEKLLHNCFHLFSVTLYNIIWNPILRNQVGIFPKD